ncbi:MAG: O-antigen ligase family protein [Polyangiaceae bacterium]
MLLALALLVWDPHATAQAPKAFAVCAVTLVGAAWCAFRRAPLVLPRALAAAGVWVAWSCLGLLWGSPSAVCGQGLAMAAFVLALLGRASWSIADLRLGLHGLATFLGVSTSGWALYQYLTGARGSYLHGGMGNPNWLGLLLVLTLLLGAPGPRALSSGRGRLKAALTLTPQLAVLYLAEARVAWVALCVAVVFAALRFRVASTQRLTPHLVWLCAVAAPVAAWGATPSGSGGWQEALAGRRFIWRSALEPLALHPLQALTGLGSGEFAGAFLEGQGALLAQLGERSAARAFQAVQSAHSDWVQALVEHGLIGWLALVAWFALALRSKPGQGWILGETAMVALMVCAIADAPLEQPAVLVLALLTTAALGGDAFGHLPRVRRFPLWWVALALLGVATRLSAGHWLSERAVSAAREHPERREAELQRAVSLDAYAAQAHFELAVALLDGGQPARSLEHADRSKRLTRSLGAELVRAKALSRLGRLRESRQALLDARLLSPGSFRVNLGLAAVELELGELDAADTSWSRAADVLPGDPRLQPLRERLKRARRALELN